jgi:acyl carrier protein
LSAPVGEQAIGIEQAIDAVRAVIERKIPRAMPHLDAETRFEALRFDSLDAAELFVGLEEIVGYALDLSARDDLETVGDLVWLRPL